MRSDLFIGFANQQQPTSKYNHRSKEFISAKLLNGIAYS